MKEITTKDLMALNELMTFENWIAVKMKNFSEMTTSKNLKTDFIKIANEHAIHHKNLLYYLTSNSK